MVFDILEALLVLGLSVFILSWYLFRRLHLRGDVRADSNYKTIKADLKTLKKQKRSTADYFLSRRSDCESNSKHNCSRSVILSLEWWR